MNAFSFGRGLESLEAVARIVSANVVTIAPRRWRASYGTTTDKIETCRIAQSLRGGQKGS